jgi:hypothetical protein
MKHLDRLEVYDVQTLHRSLAAASNAPAQAAA